MNTISNYQKLLRLIDTCLSEIAGSYLGYFDYEYRFEIWELFGPKLTEDRVKSAGYHRRVNLALMSVRKVLHFWEEAFPDDQMPHKAIQLAESVRQYDDTLYEAAELTKELLGYSEELYYSNTDFMMKIATTVGWAASAALSTAIWDEKFRSDAYSEEDDQFLVDYYEVDASLHAATSYIGGGPIDNDEKVAKNREFWIWWLTEAVPLAWASFPDSDGVA